MADAFTARLNIRKQELGKNPWKSGEDNFKDKVDDLAPKYLCVHITGVAIDEEVVFNGFQFDTAVTITKISLHARVGPSGSPLSIDLLKDDVELAAIASIQVGNKSVQADIADVNFAPTEKLGVKVKAVGSGAEPGSEITVVIHFQPQPIA